ncbi:MAG: nicotinate-nucleotide adenylyltransferase [Kiritimatiellaceae bacterium]|nr:nicotinate-nucleotide adenylyltransferase [Kiritimatiellaceae bacterium]
MIIHYPTGILCGRNTKMSEEHSERIGILGGSFDPIHTGHLTIAQDAVEQLHLDRLIFIPAAISPHKQNTAPAEGRHRLEMIRRAIANQPRFEVSDREIQRGGVSYTFDTLTQIQAELPQARLFFIIGIDTLIDLHLWWKQDELLQNFTVVPFARGGEDLANIAKRIQLGDPWKNRLLERMIQVHQVEISSSEIRKRLAAGQNLRYLVPLEVEQYIAENRLYV